MRPLHFAASTTLVLVAFSAQSFAQGLPAAPQVTVGADLKLLRFDWEPVPGADFYRLWIKPGGTLYISVGERIPASTTQAEHSIPVHLQDWERTRYVVTACNSAGCTHSAALNPRNLMLDTIGYVKASNTDPDDHFGREVALSSDGLTLAVNAEHEASGATGINGDQADNSAPNAGAVYIYRRTGAGWNQDAYIKPPIYSGGIRFGSGVPFLTQRTIALNGDGTIAAIGASAQDAGGVRGEVYVYRRKTSGWSQVATLRAPELQEGPDYFGFSVDISLDGNTIKVSSLNPRDSEGNYEGRTHIFDRSGSTWVHQATLAPFYAGDFCPKVRMSGDGRTLVANCYQAAGTERRAVTFKRVGDVWVHAGDLSLAGVFTTEQTGALNFDGTALALLQGGSVARPGWSVGIYRWEASGWVREADQFAPSNLDTYNAFGFSLAFDRDGTKLAIGDYISPAGGAGVSGSAVPGTAQDGAVFIYERTGALPLPWRLRSVVKAPHPGPGADAFGLYVALSGSGRTLAVGAMQEDSNARGIDGDQLDESAPRAGAAYLY